MKSAARRGPALITTITLVLSALIVLPGLTLVSLWALGVDLPFLSRKEARQAEGTKIPLTGRHLPAYTRITRDHFLDPKTLEPVVTYKPHKVVEEAKIITELSKLIGRVLAHDLPEGYALTERDLLPKETRPGIVAGIPPGKRAFVLTAEKVQGIHGLKRGDHFDLLGSLPVDHKGTAKFTSVVGADSPILQGTGKQAKVQVLVQNGVVVVPLAIREIPTGSPSMAKSGRAPTKPVEEVTIAVDPQEVASLHEALAIHETLICVARSGRPEDANIKTVVTGSPPPPPIHVMETIRGSRREIVVFSTPGKGPDATIQAESLPDASAGDQAYKK